MLSGLEGELGNAYSNCTAVEMITVALETEKLLSCHKRRGQSFTQVHSNRDFQTWIVNCEDLILSKLWWGLDSHSEMQIRDVINLLKADCDRDYLQKRAAVLGVGELLDEVQKRNE